MKTIKVETNHNQKLQNPCFVIIGIAPSGPIQGDAFPLEVIIETIDHSHEPVLATLIDMYRVKVMDIAMVETWPAYGLTPSAFRKTLPEDYVKNNRELCVYFYAHTEYIKTLGIYGKNAAITG